MLAALAATPAQAEWISIDTPPSGMNSTVNVSYGGAYGDDSWCDVYGSCYYNPYDARIYLGTFAATLNGAVRTSSFTVTESETCTYGRAVTDAWRCEETGSATGTLTAPVGANTFVASVQGALGTVSATSTFTVGASVVSTAVASDYVDVSRCVADCFESTLAYAMPSYTSRDVPRTVALLYRSGRAHPFGKVELDAPAVGPAGTRLQLQLKRPDGSLVTWTNGATALFYQANANLPTHLVAEFDASNIPTGRYSYTAVLQFLDPAGIAISAPSYVTATTIIVNDVNSVFGVGVELVGLQHLTWTTGGALLTDGTGSASFFAQDAGSGCASSCSFTAPSGDFSTLSGANSVVTRRYRDGTTVNFAGNGNVTTVSDRFGNRTQYQYGTNVTGVVVVTRIIDPAGVATELSYRPADIYGWKAGSLERVLQNVGPGRMTYFGIDLTMRLREIVDVDGVSSYADYDGIGRLQRVQDRNGGQWNYAYHSAATAHVSDILAPTVNTTAGPLRPEMLYREPNGAVLQLAQDSRMTFADPGSTADVNATITKVQGGTTTIAANADGAPVRITDPVGGVTTNEYDLSTGQLKRTVSPRGHDVRYAWTGALLTQTTDATTGQVVNMAYGDYDQPTRVWGSTTERLFTYNSSVAGSPIATSTIGTHAASSYTVQSDGRIALVQDGGGHIVRTFYAAGGLQNQDSTAGASFLASWFRRDGFGRVTSMRRPDGGVDSTEYDVLNRAIAQVDGLGHRTTIQRGSVFPQSVTDANGRQYVFQYNALGWLERETRPGSTVAIVRTFDPRGNLATLTNRRGGVIQRTYDALDRVATETADGKTSTYTYAPDGSSMTAANAEGTETITFDTAERMAQHRSDRPGGAWYLQGFAYDTLSLPREWNVTSSQWSGTKVQTLAFGTDRLLATVTAFGVTTQFDRDVEGLLTAIRHLSGTYSLGLNKAENQTAHHNSAGGDYSNVSVNRQLGVYASQGMDGRIAERSTAANDSLRRYTYNPDGTLAIDERSITTTTNTCSFDPYSGRTCSGWALNRVTGEDSYTYDPVGNLQIGTYDGNRLMSAKGWTMEYDADGNVFHRFAAGVDQRLTWNTLGQLVQLTTGGETISYGYDAMGSRVRKDRTVGPSVRYLYRGSDIAMELDASGVPTTEYAYRPGTDDPLTMFKGAETYYFSRDKVSNNVNGLVRLRDNAVAARYGYSAFGETRVLSDLVGNSLRFAAREQDAESGLYFNRARYYDPLMGRFISEDPIGIAGGINPYVYAGNDPINNTDPSGLCKRTKLVRQADGTSVSECADSGAGGPGAILDGVTITDSNSNPWLLSNDWSPWYVPLPDQPGADDVILKAKPAAPRAWNTFGACMGDDPGLATASFALGLVTGIQLKSPAEFRPGASPFGSVDRIFRGWPGADPNSGPVVRTLTNAGRVKRLGAYGTVATVVGGLSAGYIIGATGRCILETR